MKLQFCLLLIAVIYLQHVTSRRNFFLVSKSEGIDGTIGIYKVDQATGAKTFLRLHSEYSFGNSACYDRVGDRIFWHVGIDGWRDGTNAIMSARMDGRNFSIIENEYRGEVTSMVYYEEGSTIFYPTNGSLRSLPVATKVSTAMGDVRPVPGTQLVLDAKKRLLYFPISGNSKSVGMINVNGTGYREVFSLDGESNGIYLRGLAVHPSGDALYTCGSTYIDSTYKAYFFKYNITTGVVTYLGSKDTWRCERLATDGHELFTLDTYGDYLYRAPITDIESSTQILYLWIHTKDLSYVNFDEGYLQSNPH